MTPPTQLDRLFAENQSSILISAFATQFCHYQYIKKTEPAVEATASSFRSTYFPRTLRAGLGWGFVFIGLLAQITVSTNKIRDHGDPVLARSLRRQPWKRPQKDA